MRTIGLLGGMSWESTAHYYAILNRETMRRLGHPHSARCAMLSLDFGEVAAMQREGRWDALGAMLADGACRLEAAGADCLLICTNTMHCVAERIESATAIPLLHIADTVGAAIRDAGVGTIGLLGTAFTMEQRFYRDRLEQEFGLEVLVPEAEDRAMIHRVIFDELVGGVVRPESKAAYLAAIERLRARGAEGVILGCTEIMMLIGQDDVDLPLFDTTTLHAMAAVDFALEAA